MLHVGLQTWGSEGDCRPFLAVAHGLVQAGHAVKLLVTNVEAARWAERGVALGVEVEDVGASYIEANQSKHSGLVAHVLKSSNPAVQLRHTFEAALLPVHAEMFTAAERLSRESDILVGHVAAESLAMAAEKHGRPYITLSIVPSVRSRYTAPGILPSLGPRLNPLWWRLGRWAMNRELGPLYRKLRQGSGLPDVVDILGHLAGSGCPNLICASPTLVPRQPDWDPRHVMCGFIDLPAAAKPAGLPLPLEHFVNAGPPPVYVTFGSMLTVEQPVADIAHLVRIAVAATERVGARAVVQAPWERLPDLRLPATVFPAGPTNHTTIFPSCAAVVHHGGAGTTHAVALAGKPSVVVPFLFDQPAWAMALYRLGIAPKPIARARLSVARLAAALSTALRADMTDLAATVGQRMRAENGVADAVAAIAHEGASPG